MQSPLPDHSLAILAYAPVARRFPRWRRTLFIAFASAVFTVAFAALMPVIVHRAQIFLLQRACTGYSAPADASVNGVVPACWAALYAKLSPPGNVSRGTVLLHEMRTPRGARRLVAIDAARRCIESSSALVLLPRVLEPGTPLRLPRELPCESDGMVLKGDVVLFAAQTDAQDPAHFTFRYAHEGREHVVDGWLHDGERLTLEERPAPG
jgi:hypothetical protein